MPLVDWCISCQLPPFYRLTGKCQATFHWFAHYKTTVCALKNLKNGILRVRSLKTLSPWTGWEAAILAAVQAGISVGMRCCRYVHNIQVKDGPVWICMDLYESAFSWDSGLGYARDRRFASFGPWSRSVKMTLGVAWCLGQVLEAEVIVVPDVGCGVFGNDPLVIGGCTGAKTNRRWFLCSKKFLLGFQQFSEQ